MSENTQSKPRDGFKTPDAVAHFAATLKVNPKCKSCGGTRGYVGIRVNEDGTYTVLTCCGVPGKTEYQLLGTQINMQFQALAEQYGAALEQATQTILRFTFWGGIVYFVMVVCRANVAWKWIEAKIKRNPSTPGKVGG